MARNRKRRALPPAPLPAEIAALPRSERFKPSQAYLDRLAATAAPSTSQPPLVASAASRTTSEEVESSYHAPPSPPVASTSTLLHAPPFLPYAEQLSPVASPGTPPRRQIVGALPPHPFHSEERILPPVASPLPDYEEDEDDIALYGHAAVGTPGPPLRHESRSLSPKGVPVEASTKAEHPLPEAQMQRRSDTDQTLPAPESDIDGIPAVLDEGLNASSSDEDMSSDEDEETEDHEDDDEVERPPQQLTFQPDGDYEHSEFGLFNSDDEVEEGEIIIEDDLLSDSDLPTTRKRKRNDDDEGDGERDEHGDSSHHLPEEGEIATDPAAELSYVSRVHSRLLDPSELRFSSAAAVAAAWPRPPAETSSGLATPGVGDPSQPGGSLPPPGLMLGHSSAALSSIDSHLQQSSRSSTPLQSLDPPSRPASPSDGASIAGTEGEASIDMDMSFADLPADLVGDPAWRATGKVTIVAPTKVPRPKATYERKVLPDLGPATPPVARKSVYNGPTALSYKPSPIAIAASKATYDRSGSTGSLVLNSSGRNTPVNGTSSDKATYQRPPGGAASTSSASVQAPKPPKPDGVLPLTREEKLQRLPPKLVATFPDEIALDVASLPRVYAPPPRVTPFVRGHGISESALFGFWPAPPSLTSGKAVFPAPAPDPDAIDPATDDRAFVHVFIDNSNILYSFLNYARDRPDAKVSNYQSGAQGKVSKTVTIGGKKVRMDYSVLFSVLERGRRVERRVMACSSPLWQSLDPALEWSYEVSLLQRVPRTVAGLPKKRITTTVTTSNASKPLTKPLPPSMTQHQHMPPSFQQSQQPYPNQQGYSPAPQYPYPPAPPPPQPPHFGQYPLPPPQNQQLDPHIPPHPLPSSFVPPPQTQQLNPYGADPSAAESEEPLSRRASTRAKRRNKLRKLYAENGGEKPAPPPPPPQPIGGNVKRKQQHQQKISIVTEAKHYKEQAVDEILHLKVLESLLDHTPDPSLPPPVLVLATGDANNSEYNPQGFLGCVRRALERGWDVEIVAFSQGTSTSWVGEEAKATLAVAGRGKLKVIDLAVFAEELVA